MTTLGKSATILAGTAAAFVAVIGATSAADAKGKHFKIVGGHVHKHNFHHRHYVYAGPVVYPGCGYEKSMWWRTGTFYWKSRYYACKGWW